MKNYRQEGNVLDWVNTTGATVTSGSVVVLPFGCGVAAVDILNGATGAVQVEEVFRLPKTAGLAIGQGDIVYWNAGTGKVTKTNTDSPMGHAFVAALAGDATVDVKLIPRQA